MCCGLSTQQVRRWQRNGRLCRLSNGVYALGHAAVTETSHLHEALLIAGPGAALSNGTDLWWRELIRFPPKQVHVSAPGRRRSTSEVVIHHPREIRREWHRGLPVMPLSQSLLDGATQISFAGMRRALANVDREGLMSMAQMEELGGCGKPGSKIVREALQVHMPQLAHTKSPLEDRFLFFCERFGIELPRPNYDVAGYEVDAVWPELQLAVELDGREEHGSPAAVTVDRRRELKIRRAGFELLRYGSEQIGHDAQAAALDLRWAISKRRSEAGALPSGSG